MCIIGLNPNTSLWELLVKLSEDEAVSISSATEIKVLLTYCSQNGWAYEVVGF